jgi:hypothetical protein
MRQVRAHEWGTPIGWVMAGLLAADASSVPVAIRSTVASAKPSLLARVVYRGRVRL